ncbi:MAG: hypothetical protein HQL07_05230 [Nitrospirae bacterium]|nr:hypothetical protein [Magnetococcales bacterium]HAT49594.1 hypothetical protein [Alphaproteobacteria bacterium]
MSIVNKKYRSLFAQSRFLSDPVVLTQAWKKSQRYIRRTNWYADMLELDCSAVDLEDYVTQWRVEILFGFFTPEPMLLVPAPKSHRWTFKKGKWEPEREESDKEPLYLRPLAHLGIREQTMATAAMLCLADCIETAQGDTSVNDFFEARHRKIYSYGNRLFCTFDSETTRKDNRPLARFSWGNSESYSRYYVDYQRFLNRPQIIARNVLDQIGENEEVYIVKLDISSFFDRIHRPTLIQSLKETYNAYIKNYTLTDGESDGNFWERFKQITAWTWDTLSHDDWEIIKGGAPDGLPQGLVASGFLANAYLLNFDNVVGQHISCQDSVKSYALPEGTILHDYCRYVDDLRLVISVKNGGDKDLEEGIHTWIAGCLDEGIVHDSKDQTYRKLEINTGKTEITPFRLIEGQIGVTSRMSLIQSALSGPGDMETLQDTTADLEAMLSLATQFDCSMPSETDSRHPLDEVDTPKSEVRDDTIKRFAAYRLKDVLRKRRSMTDLEITGENRFMSQNAIDHEIEMMARKMIRAWSHDPSLSLVLRHALDLFPCPKLLRVVLESLESLLNGDSQAQRRIALYLYADLFRAGAVETGVNAPDLSIPDSADLQGYRAILCNKAVDLIKKGNTPWYVDQQALILLATWESHPLIDTGKNHPSLRHYKTLLQISAYEKVLDEESFPRELLICALVHQQMHPNPQKFSLWLVQSLKNIPEDKKIKLLELVSFNRPDLMPGILALVDKENPPWIKAEMAYLRVPKGMIHSNRPLEKLNGCNVALWNIVTRDDNPFQQEIQWIKLAIALIGKIPESDNKKQSYEQFSLRNVKIKVDDWTALLNPKYFPNKIKITLDHNGIKDPRLERPIWCDDETIWFYALGRLLRSAITGEEDFTVTPYLGRQDWDGYRGMRSSWYSRRQGLMNKPESMATEAAPFSPWVSELLMRMLQWPGVEIKDRFVEGWDRVNTPGDLRVLLKNRLKKLSKIFGFSSFLPIYPIPIKPPLRDKGRTLRIALVQTLVPQVDDFCKADPTLDNPAFRVKHKRHITEICTLVIKHLRVQQTASAEKDEDPLANLIVFPELSVHRDDIWILKRLSDKTKAIIVTGLNLRQIPSGHYVNEVCWLIPDENSSGRSWITRFQGKKHPTKLETPLGVIGHRPYQLVFELDVGRRRGYAIASAICYDATDIKLAADLTNISDMFIIPALNRDVPTFDNMVAALQYHMFQHIVLVNSGEFGGSTVQAPFSERTDKVISHLHGGKQAGVSIFDIDVNDFGPDATLSPPPRKRKTPPAGFTRFNDMNTENFSIQNDH